MKSSPPWRQSASGSKSPGRCGAGLAIHRSGIPIDLFSTSAENWYVALVVRTGSLETNLRLTQAARERGRTLLAYGPGVKNLSTGEVTRAESERHVFELCGVPFLAPEDR